MIQESKFIAEEHPEGDKYQLMMAGLFFTVWIVDSFIAKVSLFGSLPPLFIRLVPGVGAILFGLYLVNESHKLVIDAEEPVLVDWGVYSIVRHPMYLGVMLVYLGFAISTVSFFSLLMLGGIFEVYDMIADYEESRLIDQIGQGYRRYKQKVRRWRFF